MTKTPPEESFPDPHHDSYSKTVFGFWIYIVTDFILFGTLFAAYAVLHNNNFGGPTTKDVFGAKFALNQSIVLLFSSFTIGFAGVYAHRGVKKGVIIAMLITFVLGLVFTGMQFMDYSRMLSMGASWEKSAFLSSYFTLVGTHTLHILFGLLWMLVFLFPILREGITDVYLRRISCLKMFWQFLNIVWIFIFTFVYLMGVS